MFIVYDPPVPFYTYLHTDQHFAGDVDRRDMSSLVIRRQRERIDNFMDIAHRQQLELQTHSLSKTLSAILNFHRTNIDLL